MLALINVSFKTLVSAYAMKFSAQLGWPRKLIGEIGLNLNKLVVASTFLLSITEAMAIIFPGKEGIETLIMINERGRDHYGYS